MVVCLRVCFVDWKWVVGEISVERGRQAELRGPLLLLLLLRRVLGSPTNGWLVGWQERKSTVSFTSEQPTERAARTYYEHSTQRVNICPKLFGPK